MFGRHPLIAICAVIWLAATGYGLHAMMVYKSRPGPVGPTPKLWPQNALITLSADKPQLVMFAHPKCPCTEASIGELNALAAEARDKFQATVSFYEPNSNAETWTNTVNVHSARSIPGVRVVFDKDGSLAKQFGAQTSGHTVLYSPNGKLLFSGGLTGSRGHLGDNAGFESILKSINDGNASPTEMTAKVFGCDLFDRCTQSQTKKK
jgi:hypothetical protein